MLSLDNIAPHRRNGGNMEKSTATVNLCLSESSPWVTYDDIGQLL